jgi:hypothetical protein
MTNKQKGDDDMPKTIFDHSEGAVFADDIGVEQVPLPEDFLTEEVEEELEELRDFEEGEELEEDEGDDYTLSVVQEVHAAIQEINENMSTTVALLREIRNSAKALLTNKKQQKVKVQPKPVAPKARPKTKKAAANPGGKPGRPAKEAPKISVRKPAKKSR